MDPGDHADDPATAPIGEATGPTWPAGWHVEVVDETGSTNDDLIARAAVSPDRSVLATRHQTAGRGRLDRRWSAPPGTNLLVSLLFRPADDPADRIRRISLALVGAVRRVSGVEAGLKWPNDVLVGGRKLAGILAQQVATPGGSALVVGVGCNVGWAPDGAARLADAGREIDPDDLLAAVLREHDALPADVTELYRRTLVTLGRRVRVETPTGELVGRAVDVDADGRLRLIDDDAITHLLHVGDVVHLRPD